MKTIRDDIDKALEGRGMRVTQARRSVYRLLAGTCAPLSASQIDAMLRDAGAAIDLVTIYRTLDTLERCSLVTRIDRQTDGWRYGIRSGKHSHQITCSTCGSASPLDVCDLARIEQALEQRTGFTNISHSLQFHGTCPECVGKG